MTTCFFGVELSCWWCLFPAAYYCVHSSSARRQVTPFFFVVLVSLSL